MGRCSDARDRLLATASRLVHERGYTAVSVSDICSAAGLKKGSFYHFFQSKHALVLATLDRFAASHEQGMAAAAAKGGSARDQLTGMLGSMYLGYLKAQRSFGSAHGCPLGNIAQEMAHRDEEMRTKLGAIFGRWESQLARLLRAAHQRGELRVHDPDRAAEALVAYVQGATLLAKTTDDPEVFLRLAHGMIALAEAELPSIPAPQPSTDTVDPCENACQVEEVLS